MLLAMLITSANALMKRFCLWGDSEIDAVPPYSLLILRL